MPFRDPVPLEVIDSLDTGEKLVKGSHGGSEKDCLWVQDADANMRVMVQYDEGDQNYYLDTSGDGPGVGGRAFIANSPEEVLELWADALQSMGGS